MKKFFESETFVDTVTAIAIGLGLCALVLHGLDALVK
jgi:hypothetical protein